MRTVLANLEMLSDVPSGAVFEDRVKVQSGDEEGVRGLDDSGTRRERSLLDRHLDSLEEWCIRAELDYHHQKRRPPDAPAGESTRQWRDRVIKEYEGMHALEVARRESTSKDTVRHMRKLAHRDQLYGRKLEPTGNASS